jgi:hypothetical protein
MAHGVHTPAFASPAADQPPQIAAPATVTGVEGAAIEFTATASDPDGDAIEAITASFLPAGALFTPDPAATSGTFRWTPDHSQAGGYRVELSARSACRPVTISGIPQETCVTGAAQVWIDVAEGDQAPAVSAPAVVVGQEDSALRFEVFAYDLDGQGVSSLTASGLPAGATFTVDADQARGLFEWFPGYGAMGTYLVSFVAENGASGSASTSIDIQRGADRPPIVSAPPTVMGRETDLIFFTASASDSDGDAIEAFTAAPLPAGATFTLDASGAQGRFEWIPSEGQAGAHTVVLSAASACRATGVSEPVCGRGSASTTLIVAPLVAVSPARAFTTPANRVLRLGSGKPAWCVRIEPVESSYRPEDVVPGSFTLRAGGSSIASVLGKGDRSGDADRNGIDDTEVCFSKEDLRTLFASVRGLAEAPIVVEGILVGGGTIRAEHVIEVKGGGGPHAVSIAPNPLAGSGAIRFNLAASGHVRVSLFDPQGRLVRRVLDATAWPAGDALVPVAARDARGVALPSGVYFYRVESAEGSARGRFVIAR